MKKILYFLTIVVIAAVATTSCKDMDDNYKEYLEDIPTYSPPVRNLTAVSPEAGTLTLSWSIDDKSQRAKSIRILVKKTPTDVQTYDIPELVMEYTVSGLDLQAYDFDVYTIDSFGNLSIPISRTFTPIPGRE
ncbi:MAG: hypothetical protein IJ243_06480 [Prevotella sp.]|nr:hypothetical protein [Prevotella sp.]